VRLSEAEAQRLEEIFDERNIAGTRYGADQMRALDSER
jgi:hypothetical protein